MNGVTEKKKNIGYERGGVKAPLSPSSSNEYEVTKLYIVFVKPGKVFKFCSLNM